MKPARSFIRTLLGAALALACGHASSKQDFPTKPIRFTTPYPPDGSTTVLARTIAQRLDKSGKLGAPVVTRAEPSPIIPGLPTLAASGLPG